MSDNSSSPWYWAGKEYVTETRQFDYLRDGPPRFRGCHVVDKPPSENRPSENPPKEPPEDNLPENQLANYMKELHDTATGVLRLVDKICFMTDLDNLAHYYQCPKILAKPNLNDRILKILGQVILLKEIAHIIEDDVEGMAIIFPAKRSK
ncbi:hypothetical protein RRF57_012305 [Xylaria bambusicola]|uniref:Uncharacterized protein n=1 Tax=Xylaria bambusicola TaxID=326684 RepID=A0AAN7ZEM1_9PEZI